MSNAKPHIGILGNSPVSDVPVGWCRWLYQYFSDLERKGQCSLKVIGCSELEPGARVPWDPRPIERRQQSPGPLPAEVRKCAFDALVSLSICSDLYLAEIVRLGVPLVSLDFQPVDLQCDSVIFDGTSGGRLLGQKLAATGHRQVMFVSCYRRDRAAPKGAEACIEDDGSIDRRLGVLEGLRDSPATLWPAFPRIDGDTTPRVRQRLQQYLQSASCLPDAIVGHDTGYVGSIWDLLGTTGINMPKRVSLLSFAAEPSPSPYAQKISHVLFNWRAMAEVGWRLLTSRLRDRKIAPRVERLQGQYREQGSLFDQRSK